MTARAAPLAARRRLRGAIACLVFALSLGACSGVENWEEVRAPRQPAAKPVDYVARVSFRSGSTSLTANERQHITQFLGRVEAEPHDRVSVALRLGIGDAEDRLALARGRTVADNLRRRGYDPILTTAADPDEMGSGVFVTVRRYVVTLPKCPDWDASPGWSFGNQPASNFGCATATNLGIMVADPADLVHGADPGPADGERVSRSVFRYREDKVKKIKVITTTEQFATEEGAGQDSMQQMFKALTGGGL